MSAARGRRWLESSSVGAAVVLVAALVGMVNYLGWKYHRRFDWTSSQLYSLSDKSRQLLRDLDRDVEAIVFMTPSSQLYGPVTEMLDRFDAESPRFTVRRIDPERNPAEAKQLIDRFDVKSLSSVVLESGGERRVIEEADLAELDYSGMQYGQAPQVREFLGEQKIAGAILELMEDRKPRILFTVGHGEVALDDFSDGGLSRAKELLGEDNFSMEPWASLGQDAVPDGTDLVVVAGPKVAFLAPELEALRRFVVAGGRLLLLLDPTLTEEGLEPTGFETWLDAFGVRLDADIVIDPANPLPFYSAETFFANDYAAHAITDALEQASYPVILSLARSVRRGEDSGEGVTTTELLRTSARAWGETNLHDLDAVARDGDDPAGPLSLAVAVELAPPSDEEDDALVVLDDDGEDVAGAEEEPEDASAVAAADDSSGAADEGEGSKARGGRLVVFGDSDFASNAQLSNVGNPVLLLNTMNWLVERENLLAIPPRQADQIQLNLSRSQLMSVYWLVLLVLPAIAVVVGIGVYLRRRR